MMSDCFATFPGNWFIVISTFLLLNRGKVIIDYIVLSIIILFHDGLSQIPAYLSFKSEESVFDFSFREELLSVS